MQDLAVSEPDYLQWMLGQDFSPEVMQIVRDALKGKFPAPPVTDAEKPHTPSAAATLRQPLSSCPRLREPRT